MKPLGRSRSGRTYAPALGPSRSPERFHFFFHEDLWNHLWFQAIKTRETTKSDQKSTNPCHKKKKRVFYLKPNNFLVLIITLIFNIYSRVIKTCMACDECSSFAILIFSTILLCGITAGTITEREVCCFLWRCQYRCIKRSKYMNKYIMARTTCPNHIVYSLNIFDLTRCLGPSHWYFKKYLWFCPMHVANHIIYR